MGSPIALRSDYCGADLRRLARQSKDADQTRRLLALALVYDGGRRRAAAELGGVTLQIIRDWVVRFNAAGPAGLINRKAPGAPQKLTAAQRRALYDLVDQGPIPAIHGVVRWRLKDLAAWIHEEFAITLDETSISRDLRAEGFRKISARPRHYGQNELAQEAFKKTSRPSWRRSRPSGRRAVR